MASRKEYEIAIKIAGEIAKSLPASVSTTKSELNKIARHAVVSSNDVKHSFSESFESTRGGFEKLSGFAENTFHAIAQAAEVATVATAAIAAASVTVGSDFEAQMSTVQAISGASGSEFEDLTEKAKELGENTAFSATEAGEAMEYMAMAGWKTQDMLDGIDPLLNLAAASGEDLGTTADIVTDALTAFGLAASDTAEFADVLAAASSNSNTNVAMMGETFKYAASIAGSLGYDIKDVATYAGLMANAGIKSEMAGTQLRKIMVEMASGTKLSAAAFGDLEISSTNADGSMRELHEVMDDLRFAFAQMTESEQAANAESIAGKTAMSGLLSIVNASEADYRKLQVAIEDSSGAAKAMAGIRLDNLRGDLTLLKSAAEGLGIEIYDEIKEPLRQGTQLITEFVSAATRELKSSHVIEKVSDGIIKKVPVAIRQLKEVIGVFWEMSEPLRAVGGWFFEHPAVIADGIAAIGSVIVAYKVTSGVLSLTKAMKAAALVFTNPVAAGIAGVAAAIGVVGGAVAHMKIASEDLKNQNLAEHFGEISLSMSEIQEVAEYLTGSRGLKAAQQALEEFGKSDAIQKNIQDSVNAINKMNWKLSIGMELSEEDKESYQEEIQEYIWQTKDLLRQEQYALSLHLAVFAEGDIERQTIVNQINSFYENSYSELERLGGMLNVAVTEAFSDGLLTIDEAKVISELQQQMANIQKAIVASEQEAEFKALEMELSGKDIDVESFQATQEELAQKVAESDEAYREVHIKELAALSSAKQSGEITQEQYEFGANEFYENYLSNITESRTEAIRFQTDTILKLYPEAEDAIQSFDEILDKYFTESSLQEWAERPAAYLDAIVKDFRESGLDQETRAAIDSLLLPMEEELPKLEELRDLYLEKGEAVPKAVSEGITKTYLLKALAGDIDGLYYYLGEAAEGNEAYQEVIDYLLEQGIAMPEQVHKGIETGRATLDEGINDLYHHTQQKFRDVFASGIQATVNANLEIRVKSNSTGLPTEISWAGRSRSAMQESFAGNVSKKSLEDLKGIEGHAEGGIFTTPHIAQFAEEGPEAVIPFKRPEQAREIWLQSGQMLGLIQKNQNVQNIENSEWIQRQSEEITSFISNKDLTNSYQSTASYAAESKQNQNIYQIVKQIEQENGGHFDYSIWSQESSFINNEQPVIVTSIPVSAHAEGGIFTIPHLAQIAEEGAEAVIPFSRPEQAREIWMQSGAALGFFSSSEDKNIRSSIEGDRGGFYSSKINNIVEQMSFLQTKSRAEEALSALQEQTNLGDQNYQFFYNPVFQIQSDSGGLEEKIKETVKMSEDEFEEHLLRFLRNQKRFSLGEVTT